jgi:hypothetical protein
MINNVQVDKPHSILLNAIATLSLDAILLNTTQVHTVKGRKKALNLDGDQVVKELLFMADGKPVLVLTNGMYRLSKKNLANLLQVDVDKLVMPLSSQVKVRNSSIVWLFIELFSIGNFGI